MRKLSLYLIILLTGLMCSCEHTIEPEDTSQSIKEVYLIQSRLLWNEDENGVAVSNEPKPLMLGYLYLEVNTGKAIAGKGSDFNQVKTYDYGTIGSKEVQRFTAILSKYNTDKHYNKVAKGVMLPLYSGPEYAFLIVREDGSETYISFKPYLLPQELTDIYKALDFNVWELEELPSTTGIDKRKILRLKELTLQHIDKTGWPPQPAKVKYTPPKISN